LFVAAEIRGRPDHTSFEVELLLRGNPVAGANVVIKDGDTGVSLNLEAKGGDRAGYRGTLGRYVRTVELAITSGEDRLEARLVGPAPHAISRPRNHDIVRRADFDELTVQWEADAPAERVEIRAKGLPPVELEGDPFEHDLPLNALGNGDQEIEVERETRVELSGGAEGSVMRSTYTVDNRFTLEG
jgi:hypothetical protein